MTRPLVVRFGALGDMVLLTVAIRILHERFGEPVDILSSGNWTEPLLRDQPGVGDIYILHSRRWPFWLSINQWRIVRQLRQRAPGPAWLFDAQNDKTRWLLHRAGWQSEQLALLEGLPDIAGEHFCDRWRRFALLDPPVLGSQQRIADLAEAVPQLQLSAQDRANAEFWLRGLGLAGRPCILIQVGNKRTMRRGDARRPSNTKYWPEQHWASVLRALRASHPDHAILLLGIATEAALNDRILAIARIEDAHNLARDMRVARLMALAERASGMLSVDTGPAHVAAALGCPVLTLFDSPAKAAMYAPRGPGQAARCVVVSREPTPSLLNITPQQVLVAWRAMRIENETGGLDPVRRSQAGHRSVQCSALPGGKLPA